MRRLAAGDIVLKALGLLLLLTAAAPKGHELPTVPVTNTDLRGPASCGCFGAVHVDRWITLFAIDLPAVIARPRTHHRQHDALTGDSVRWIIAERITAPTTDGSDMQTTREGVLPGVPAAFTLKSGGSRP